MNKYRYEVLESGAEGWFHSAYNHENSEMQMLKVFEHAAEIYHSEQDGWDDSWPVTLDVFTDKGIKVGTFVVEREYEPVFKAMRGEK